ncbi:MAG: hypothetical protein QXD13_00620 [Candidatus Pacearchaeota archaeon]
MNKKQKIILGIALLIVTVIVIFIFSNNPNNASAQTPEEVAKCLSEKGVVMYGSKYCPHCAEQKALFKDAFSLINYVECTKKPEECSGLAGVPAWKVGESIYYGTTGLSDLAGLAGC